MENEEGGANSVWTAQAPPDTGTLTSGRRAVLGPGRPGCGWSRPSPGWKSPCLRPEASHWKVATGARGPRSRYRDTGPRRPTVGLLPPGQQRERLTQPQPRSQGRADGENRAPALARSPFSSVEPRSPSFPSCREAAWSSGAFSFFRRRRPSHPSAVVTFALRVCDFAQLTF